MKQETSCVVSRNLLRGKHTRTARRINFDCKHDECSLRICSPLSTTFCASKVGFSRARQFWKIIVAFKKKYLPIKCIGNYKVLLLLFVWRCFLLGNATSFFTWLLNVRVAIGSIKHLFGKILKHFLDFLFINKLIKWEY